MQHEETIMPTATGTGNETMKRIGFSVTGDPLPEDSCLCWTYVLHACLLSCRIFARIILRALVGSLYSR